MAVTATVYALAKYLGVSESTARSLLPKSVTAPIAMGISETIGGVPALSAVFAILTGVLGAATGKIVFDLLAVKSMMVRGFALGAQAHGIGTARAYLVSADAGAFAGLALGLHGLTGVAIGRALDCMSGDRRSTVPVIAHFIRRAS